MDISELVLYSEFRDINVFMWLINLLGIHIIIIIINFLSNLLGFLCIFDFS